MNNITNELSSIFWIFLIIGLLSLAGILFLAVFSAMTISSKESRAEEKRNGLEPEIQKEKPMRELQRLVLPDGTVFTVKKGKIFYYLFVDDVKFGPFLTINRAKKYAIMKFNLYWSL